MQQGLPRRTAGRRPGHHRRAGGTLPSGFLKVPRQRGLPRGAAPIASCVPG